MISLADAIHETFANREWSNAERDSIEDVLDAAHAVANFELTIDEALKMGVLPDEDGHRATPAFARVRAVLAASPNDPRRKSLLTLLDIVIAAQPGVQTNMGFMTHEALRSSGITVRNRPVRSAA